MSGSTPATSSKVEEKPPPQATPAAITLEINPSRRQRLITTLTFPLLILLAIPFWWYVTSIQRLPLPTARISALETATTRYVNTQILLTSDDDVFPSTSQDETVNALRRISEEVTSGADGIYDQQEGHERGKRVWDLVAEPAPESHEANPLRIHMRSWDQANSSLPLQPYIQAPEMGLTPGGPGPGTQVVPIHSEQSSDPLLSQHVQIALIKSLMALFPSPPNFEIPLRALKYQPNVTLSFVLLNEDASDGGYVRSWDIEGAIRDHFMPHLKPLQQVYNFSIESQVLYHAPLAFEPTYGPGPASRTGKGHRLDAALEAAGGGDEEAEALVELQLEEQKDEAWLVGEEEMKVFVNSERWSLDSGSSNNPVLRFLLFVPAAKHRPMRLATPDSAQSFLLPQYGAVTILDPPASTSPEAVYHLGPSVLEAPFHLFTQHLYSLLALPQLPRTISPNPPLNPLSPPSYLIPDISPWQVDHILRMRTLENSQEARQTLSGIVRLVAKIREMKVGPLVRDRVLGAVERLEQMDRTQDPLEAFILSRDAVGLANQAFFDPSMMGLLYFPDEHKFAVYTPLFAPVGVPVLVGMIKEGLGWWRRRRRR